MSKRLIHISLALSVLMATVPVAANAHVLQTDGDLGAVLHILPDDAPVAGVPTTYRLSFESNQSGFSLDRCDCSVTYSADGIKPIREPLTASSANGSTDTYTFTKPAVYSLTVAGSPRQGAGFKPFSLRYVVRVGGGDAGPRPIPPLLWIGLGMVIALVLLYSYIGGYTNKKEKS